MVDDENHMIVFNERIEAMIENDSTFRETIYFVHCLKSPLILG